MRVLLLSNYYAPETVGSGVWITDLAVDLKRLGHQVTVVTSFPSYPSGRIFPAYASHRHLRETIDGIDVIRTYTYGGGSQGFCVKVLGFAAFCASSVLGGLAELPRADVVYAILPPLPLGVSGWLLARAARCPLVVNVQDIYPDVAIGAGLLRNARAIGALRRMEAWVYRKAARIVVISEGFRRNLLAKGVPSERVAVVPNWADPDAIRPGARLNGFRRELGVNGEFLVLYAGSLSLNSHLDPVIDAAGLLAAERFAFVIAGEGAYKEQLERKARRLGLANVRFLPFQPIERYAEVLAAADATLVTLAPAATCASAPSKIYKQMAAARPVIAVAEAESEVGRLVGESGCGVRVPPGNAPALAEALRRAAAHPEECARMGRDGREYVERYCSRARSVAAIEMVLREAAGHAQPRGSASSERKSPESVLTGKGLVDHSAHLSGKRFRGMILKRTMDAAASLVGIAVLSPLWLLCAAMVRLSSRGPVLFAQQRLGRHGRPFRLLKFRTMYTGAADLRNPDGSAYTGPDDPRVTPVGRFLRRTSLDELPQLVNVLRGQMSLVGPRPDQVDQLRFYTEVEKRKLAVRPGLTGLAQIGGRNRISWERRKALDVEYVKRQSLALDLAILAKTVPYVLLSRGVHAPAGRGCA